MSENKPATVPSVDDVVNRAFIGRKPCGCVCAADLDCDPKTTAEYLSRGYTVEVVEADDAIRLMREYRCLHD